MTMGVDEHKSIIMHRLVDSDQFNCTISIKKVKIYNALTLFYQGSLLLWILIRLICRKLTEIDDISCGIARRKPVVKHKHLPGRGAVELNNGQ